MKKIIGLLLLTNVLLAEPPKLVVMIVGDQVRADYLERFRDQLLPHGLRRFRENGVYFTQARIDHAQTVTAPGHVLFGSGLSPSQSGIVGNQWYDRKLQKRVLGIDPQYFQGTSLAHRWHQYWPQGRVVSVSFKDRGSLLFGGPGQNEVYWWEKEAGGFRTQSQSPSWLTDFNKTQGAEKKRNYKTAPEADRWVAALALDIFKRHSLGQGSSPDLLTISFSALDLVGHRYGPDHPRTHEAFLNLDRSIALLIETVEKELGNNVLWVFSSDHGVTPSPPLSKRMSFRVKNLPSPEVIESASAPFIYLKEPNEETAAALKQKLLEKSEVSAVWTRWEIERGSVPPEIRSGYWPERSGDLWVVLKPGHIFSDHLSGTTHGQPTDDDARVPLAFYGNGLFAQERSDVLSPGVAVPTILQRFGKTTRDLRAPVALESKPLQRIAFGSCLNQNRPQPIWDKILERKPDAFIFLGDNVYADTRNPAELKTAYAKLAAQPGFQRLQEETPYLLATWDDHDYGEDNAGAEFPIKKESRDIFLDFWNIPASSPRRLHEGVYGSEVYGPPGKRTQIILLDLRTFKTKDQLMGADQWAWLETALKEPAELRIVASSIQIIPEQHRWEKWATHPAERERLMKRLTDPALGKVVLISGDRHLGEISSDGKLYEITASGLNTAPGGSDNEPNRYRTHAKPFRKHHFGFLDILWGTSASKVRLELVDSAGALRESVFVE